MLAEQMLSRVEYVHSKHFIHRDLKPSNFVIGLGAKANVVYFIDFGLAKRYRNQKTLQHIPSCDGKTLTGTPRYASISNHLGLEQSRRDDVESLGYILVYFMIGQLPWQGLKARNQKAKYELIMQKKQETALSTLCAKCPVCFRKLLEYARGLGFDQGPDTALLHKLFKGEMSENSITNDSAFDWIGDEAGLVGEQTPDASDRLPLTDTTAAKAKPTSENNGRRASRNAAISTSSSQQVSNANGSTRIGITALAPTASPKVGNVSRTVANPSYGRGYGTGEDGMKTSCPSEQGRASVSIADLPSANSGNPAGNDNGNISGWRTAESSPTMKNGSRQLNNSVQATKPVCTLCGKTAHTYQALTCAGCGSNLRHTTINNNEDAALQLQKGRKNGAHSSRPLTAERREPLDNAAPSSYATTTFKVSKIGGTGNTPSAQSPRFETTDTNMLYSRPNAGGFSGVERDSSLIKVDRLNRVVQ
jgi:serine/threonine protein kinase